MTYRGEVKHYRPPLGIKPTVADHELVHTWSVIGIPTREMCVRLGERFNLGKPMAMATLYYHFRKDFVPTKPGAKWKPARLKMKFNTHLSDEIRREIAAVNARRANGKAKR